MEPFQVLSANRVPSYENAVSELGATWRLRGVHSSAAMRWARFLVSTAYASAVTGADRTRSGLLRFTKRPFLAPEAATRVDCPENLHRSNIRADTLGLCPPNKFSITTQIIKSPPFFLCQATVARELGFKQSAESNTRAVCCMYTAINCFHKWMWQQFTIMWLVAMHRWRIL